MEAVANYAFEKRLPDELSFRKGAKLKVFEYIIEEDGSCEWVKAELDGNVGHAPITYLEIKPAPWYRQDCKTRDRASEILLKKNDKGRLMFPDGAFLIRPSSKAQSAGFSLSMKSGTNVQHLMIFRHDMLRRFYIYAERTFETLNELVDFYKKAVPGTENIFLRDMIEVDGRQMVVVNYKFEPREEDEITLAAGDIVAVMDDSDKDWLKGEIIQGAGKGKTGLFPRTYVAPLPRN